MSDEVDLVNAAAAARLVGVSRTTVSGWARKGWLPVALRVPSRGHTGSTAYFCPADVLARKAWLDARRAGKVVGPGGQYHNTPPAAPGSVVVAGIRFPAWVGPELARRRAMWESRGCDRSAPGRAA